MNRNYQKELDGIIEKISRDNKPSLLLHSCCAPCSSYVLEYLSEHFNITVFYYNPNIYPEAEFYKRVEEQKRLIKEFNLSNIKFLEGRFDTSKFYEKIKGHENDTEGGDRCSICYNIRLEETAETAKKLGFEYFTTTLSISPMKNAVKLNTIGETIAEKYGLKYLISDFKKKNGYKRSIELSKEYNLYRQNYCGCIFSINMAKKKENNMIKLVVSDVDGTLVPDGSSVLNPEYYQVIKQLKKKGIIFAAASGRQYASLLKLFEPVKDDIIFIAENGAFISCRDNVMAVEVMNRQITNELIEDMKKIPDCEILASGKYIAYTEADNKEFLDWMINGYNFDIEKVDDILAVSEDFIKVSLYNKEDASQAAQETLVPKWKEKIKIVCAGKEWMDCMNKTVNKGAALEKIQKNMGVSKQETMVFGDNLNDIEMLKCAVESYAIGNAREEVKAAAKNVADTNTNDGVLKQIKKLIY